MRLFNNSYSFRRNIFFLIMLYFSDSNLVFSKILLSSTKCNNLVTIAPYSGINTTALVNLPLYNQDFLLLENRYKLSKKQLRPESFCSPAFFELSGMITGLANATIKDHVVNSGDFNLNSAELDLASHFPWVTTFLDFAYNSPPPTPAGIIGGTNLYLDRIFVTVGNLNQLPFYLTIGRRYIPFGQYNSYMITGSLTQSIGKIEAGSLLIGYQYPESNTNYTAIYIIKGVKKLFWDSSQSNIAGLTTGYIFNNKFSTVDLGFDYIQSLTAAQGFINITDDKIPGIDWHAKIEINKITLLAEYTKALKRFNSSNLSYYNYGARPAATNFELGYHFSTGSKKSVIAIGFGKTYESASLGLPEEKISATYNISLYSHVILGVQYSHNINYPLSTTNTKNNSEISPKNLIISRVILYF